MSEFAYMVLTSDIEYNQQSPRNSQTAKGIPGVPDPGQNFGH
jgi:hypothetical protein